MERAQEYKARYCHRSARLTLTTMKDDSWDFGEEGKKGGKSRAKRVGREIKSAANEAGLQGINANELPRVWNMCLKKRAHSEVGSTHVYDDERRELVCTARRSVLEHFVKLFG
jgi:hypothetical protein